jgi:glycosyltransferase involved in cell wall biosynthesis
LREYDFLMAVSSWTATLLSYLYGVQAGHIMISLPEEAYDLSGGPNRGERDSYIVVPTVSMGRAEERFLEELSRVGLRLVSFGPKAVKGTHHLGYLSEAEVRSTLQGAAATLFLFDYEALGLIPFESLAVGTPVVTLPKHGVLEQWRENPFVTFGSNADEVIAACRNWVNNPLNPEGRSQAQATVEEYRSKVAGPKLAAYLESVIQRPRSQSTG